MKNYCINEFKILLIWHFVCELRILCKHISSQVVVPEFAVEKQEIAECFWEERRVLQQKVQFFEGTIGVFINIHKSLVQKCNGIQFFLRSRRHVQKSLSSSCKVLDGVLDGSLKVECLNQSSLFEGLTVSNTLDLNIRSIGAHPQFRMLPNSLLYDLSNVFERRSQLFLLVVTESNVVSNFTVISDFVHSVNEFESGLLEFSFLVKNASFINDDI